MSAPTLPPELFVMIIDHLDVHTLVRCREVCKILRNLIDHSPSFQYKIELAVAGMVDGPPSDLGPIERLHILNAHQTAWDQLWWKESHVPTIPSESSWVYSGNILAIGYRRNDDFFVTLTQLPSVLRGIEEKTWSIVIKGNYVGCSFEIDPSQDLIVLVNEVRGAYGYLYRHVHLHMLSTGEPHPLSAWVLIHRDRPRLSGRRVYLIQIVDDMVGVQCTETNYLTIWDWKTGELKMNMWEGCFSFLTKDLAMTGVSTGLALNIYDLRLSSNVEGTHAKIPLCTFQFPRHAASTSVLTGIFTDLSSGKTSRYTHSAPFSISQNDRLYAFRCRASDHSPFSALTLMVFAPLSTLMSHIDSLRAGETRRSFSWEEWGEKGARVLKFYPPFDSDSVVRCVHGMKFSTVNNNHIEVYDFNRLSFRRGVQSGTAPRHPLSIVTNTVWMQPVYSSLPYQVRSAPLPDGQPLSPPCHSISITEDCLIPLMDWADLPPVWPIFSF